MNTFDLQEAVINGTDTERAEAFLAAHNAGLIYAVTGCNLCTVDFFATEAEAVAARVAERPEWEHNTDKLWCGGSGDGITFSKDEAEVWAAEGGGE